MPLTILPKSIYLHVPRTGGTWTTSALLRAVSGAYTNLIWEHWTLEMAREKWGSEHKPFFCFIRHPGDWYLSYWRLRNKTYWGGYPIDYPCGSPDFNTFVSCAFEKYPGHLSRTYRSYLGTSFDGIDFFGKYENIHNSLIMALDFCREEYDKELLLSTPIENVSDKSDNSHYSLENWEKLVETESSIFKEFNYTTDLSDFNAGMR